MAFKGLKGALSSLTEGSSLKTQLEVGEEIIFKAPASRFVKTGNTLGGTLFITNKRVIYEAGNINLTSKQRDLTDIMKLEEIIGYSFADNVGMFNMVAVPGLNKDKAIRIQTIDTSNVYNVGGKSQEIIDLLKDICKNAEELDKEGYLKNIKGNVLGRKLSENIKSNPSEVNIHSNTNICSSCGMSNAEGVKFCGDCGTKLSLDCPECGMQIVQGQKFCNECGASLIPKCPQCGEEVKDGVKFCNECGTKL